MVDMKYQATPPSMSDQDNSILQCDSTGALKVTMQPYSTAQTQVNATSGNVSNANAVATIPAVAGKTNYLSSFVLTAGGATAAACVTATITGVKNGPLSYTFCTPAGAAASAYPLQVTFDQPLQGNAVNTAIVVTLPALGAGNTFACATASGFYQ